MSYVTLQLRLYRKFVLMFVLNPLQPLSGETLTYATANVEDGARLDISAAGFWGGQHQKAYFDVKVFNPNAFSYRGSQVSSLYRKFEKDKRRKYEQRIREIEMASFTPLVTPGKKIGVVYESMATLASCLSTSSNYCGTDNFLQWICRLDCCMLCGRSDERSDAYRHWICIS